MNNIKNQGFTLIEVLLYLAIASALLFAVSGFVVLSFQSRAEGQVISEVEQQGQHMLQTITNRVRGSGAITTPAASTNGTTLTLATSSGATNPSVVSLSGTTLSITEGSGSPVILHNSQVNVSGLTFTNASRPSTPGIVRIQFTLSYNSTSSRREYNYSKVFYGSASLR